MSEPATRARGRVTGNQSPRPIITISRQHGARGAVVARAVAERLGFACWDRELVGAIAAQARVEPSVIAAFDEHLRDGEPAASRPGFGAYLSGLEQVARAIARRGGAVVVGRGIGFLVGHEACLRVRVVCPLEQRVAGLVERSELGFETARATIDFVDGERRAFLREVHGVDVEDPTNFDLLVSTGSLTVDGAADVVVSAYRTRFEDRRWPRPSATMPAVPPTERP